MAVTGSLVGDFSSFVAEVNKAQVGLRAFEMESEKVGLALDRMVDSFSGRKILEEGAMLNRMFQNTGDIALLTERELKQVGATAAEAVEKMNRLGLEVPANLQNLANASAKTRTATEGLHTSLSRFDGILGALGFNISSEVRALTEMSAAVGQTVSQLGLLATAGLAAGAAFAGWKIGRLIAEMAGLDDQIGKTTASILGLGDVTAEVSGARLDLLAKASQIAGHEITNLKEAMDIMAEASRKHDVAFVTSATVIAGWRAEIAKVVGKGELGQLKDDIESGVFSMERLTQRYNISSDAIKLFIADLKGVTDGMHSAEEATAAFEKELLESAKAAHQVEQSIKQTVDFSIDQIGKRTTAELHYVNASIAGTKQLQQVQQENADFVMRTTLSETDYKILKIREWEQATIAAFRGTEQQLNAFTDAVRVRAQQQVDALSQVAEIVTVIGGGSQSLLRPDTQMQIHSGPAGGSAFSLPEFRLPGFSLTGRASGGPVSAGSTYLVGENGPELLHMGANGMVSPNGGGGGAIVVQLVVDGRVLAQVVNDQNTRAMRQSRQWPSA